MSITPDLLLVAGLSWNEAPLVVVWFHRLSPPIEVKLWLMDFWLKLSTGLYNWAKGRENMSGAVRKPRGFYDLPDTNNNSYQIFRYPTKLDEKKNFENRSTSSSA